jgi:histone arginine demethylase JMJD6
MKIAESDKGKKIKIKLKNYIHYLVHQEDDSPLYLFENCDENKKIKKKYDVPKFFKEDYFNYINELKRPPFRWLLIGPKRSGTTLHKDPLDTSAWNVSLQGYKLWVFFENKYPKWIVNGRQYKQAEENMEAIDYFLIHLPRLREKEPNIQIKTCIQGPNDTVFVPGGWWHAVLNLTDTLAVTQNYMNSVNFDVVWRSLRINRKVFSEYLLKNFRKKNPDLYHKAKMLNTRDQFVLGSQRTGKNFVEDFSTTSLESSDSGTESRESDYKTDYEKSDDGSGSDSDSSKNSIEIANQSISEDD